MKKLTRRLSVVSLLLFAAASVQAENAVFRVTPYVQHPATNAMTLKFVSDSNVAATVSWWKKGDLSTIQSDAAVTPTLASDLQYYGDSHAKQYLPEMTPYMYTKRITGLVADTEYEYSVQLAGGPTYTKGFRTAPSAFRPVRFIAYSDSETEPASNGSAVTWDNFAQDADTNPSATSRKYLVDQTVGYASNICTMVSRKPDFFVIAGDLVQTGSCQTHWDEFWRHNAGALNDPAGSIPIMAALGNHEYSSYSAQYGEQGAKKFLSYFEFEPNTANVDADQKQRFHRLDYGPVAVIFIDPNNGPDNEPPAGTAWSWAWEYSHPHPLDTNAQLYESRIDGGVDKSSRVPQFQEGSAQYQWLEEQLADAQTNKLFTFLVCHQCPYSAGYHGRASGELGRGGEDENLSGVPTRCLTNLVFKYGVDAWICGHDEMYEHSQVTGEETLPDGTKRATTLNVYDIGIGGDGLRGCRITTNPNPNEVFRAHVDAPEVYDNGDWQTGTLVSGGKHYGHLEVDVTTNETGKWTAKLTPVYNFVSKNASTGALTFERRTYPDEIVVTNLTYSPAPPAPVDTAIHVETSGNDATGDGTSAKPYATIAKALSVAVADDVIKVGEGEFALGATLAIEKAVTISGAGADKTVLKAPTMATYLAIDLNHADAILEKVAVTGIYFKSKPTGTTYETYNKDGQSWAALAVKVRQGVFRDSEIRNNYATLQYGKGPWLWVTGGEARRVKVIDNTYSRTGNSCEGYAVYMEGAGVFADGEIARNTCPGECQGAIKMAGNAQLVNSSVHDNNGQAAKYYGGVYAGGAGNVVEKCRIYNNNNGLYLASGTARNNLIYNNTTTAEGYFAGVSLGGGNFYHNTVYGNTTPNDAVGYSGLYMSGGTAKNNIIVGNGTVGGLNLTGGTFTKNLVETTPSRGTDNVVGQPAFADAANGDFALTLGSAALDIGETIASVTDDFVGTVRPQGTAPDAGAYEFTRGTTLDCAVKVLGTGVVKQGGTIDGVSAVVTGASGSETYQWYVDDVLSSETTATPSFTGLSGGKHTIRLIVTDGGTPVEDTVADAVTVKPVTVYVSTTGSETFPYATPETAARTVNTALTALYADSATPGRVNVAAGTYYATGTLNLGLPIEVVGAGRDVTIISAGKIKSRNATLGHAQAVVRDLTFTGATNQSHGAGVYLTNGKLINVHVTRSYQTGSGDNYNHGAGVLMENGTITNCVIDYNYLKADYHGSKGVGVYMTGGTLVDSEIAHNWMTRTQHNGIGVWANAGTIMRCRIYDNYSTSNSGNGSASGAGNVSSGHGANLSGSAVLEDSLVYSNGICGVMMSGSAIVRNCAIYGHRKGTFNWFAGVNMTGGTLVHCTITDNCSSGETLGKSGLWQTGGTAYNNIIWGNGGTAGSCLVSGGTFRNNVTDSLANDGGYVVNDPKFVNAATNDFHLMRGATAIDAGAASAVDHDLDGLARPLGDGPDIGCYEAVPSVEPGVSITPGAASVPKGGALTAEARLENVEVGEATITWTLIGAVTNQVSGVGAGYLSFTHTATVVGAYELALSVTYRGQTYPAAGTVPYAVKPVTVYVAEDGGNISPYETPEKAACSVNDAFNALWMDAASTGLVSIAAGDYELVDTLTVLQPVRIVGAGREVTRLHGTGLANNERAISLMHDDALLGDLTVCGVTNNVEGGGVAVRIEKGRMENVRVTKVYANPNGANIWGVCLYLQSGMVTNCVFNDNVANSNWGSTMGIGAYMSGGLLVDCEICDSHLNRNEYIGLGLYANGGTARRCKIHHITGYRASDTRGAVCVGWDNNQGTVEDCIISDCTYGAFVTGKGTLRNSVIARCKGAQPGDGASVLKAGGVIQEGGTVINCTIAGNGSSAAPDCADYRISINSYYTGVSKNNIAPSALVTDARLTQANNVFNVDPKIKNVAAGKYKLMSGSPAIDAADPAAWTWSDLGTAKDILGNPRVNRYGTGGQLDCGACEYTPTGFIVILR